MRKIITLLLAVVLSLSLMGCNSSTGSRTTAITPVESFSEGLALVKQNNKYGYIDTTGHLKIPIQFDEAESFKDGIAKVTISADNDTYQAYINSEGNTIFDYRNYKDKYSEIYNCSEGLIGVSKTIEGTYDSEPYTEYGYIDLSGQEIIPLQKEWSFWGNNMTYSNYEVMNDNGLMMDFHNGLAFIKKEDSAYANKWGLIDSSGKIVATEIEIDHVYYNFSDGIAITTYQRAEPVVQIINTKGKKTEIRAEYWYVSLGAYSEGLIAYQTYEDYNSGKDMRESSGYINSDGKTVIDLSDYSDLRLSDFSDNMACIIFTGKDGKEYSAYIDKTGQLISQPQNEFLYAPYNEGYAWWLDYSSYQSSNKCIGYIVNSNFEIISKEIEFDEDFGVHGFSNGFSLLSQNGKPVFVDTAGNILEILTAD